MPKLTVIIPTYNEEHYLEDALYSVKFADEIIVVDSFSLDNTLQIAKQFNCIITQRKFDDFSSQKNHALTFATNEWVLFLDADERITNTLQIEILNTINNPKHSGYKLNFPHFYMNRFLYHHDNDVTRLVKRELCHFEGDVHEKLIVKGTIGKLKNPVLHFTYKGLSNYIGKKDSYAWFQANQLFKKNKKATCFHLAFKPFYRFFSSYIIKGGFLDGIPGLAVASVNAYGVFSRYAKLILQQKGLK
ncbi:glycosyltransferase family 2 protein [Ichthyenterobacterium magnum]|uniref:Glycosyl transferase family 2 n=1 Tax=Ichthyenterobacterium magnum TaxID=1230530 RepID=A0A420DH11_9FLAO|nr:glycosyltransferase family 2 protein [Ichthyenterobacterium magnum]RKE92360.1 glycosyl transferase family 2 [Ichthyenterobacterium magnum]